MIEKTNQLPVMNEFSETCQQVIPLLDGPDTLAKTLPGLREQLQSLATCELPDRQAVMTQASDRLAQTAQDSYAAGLRRASLVSQVFPGKSLTINAEVVDNDTQIITVNRFTRNAGTTPQVAEDLYGQARNDTISSITADIEISASDPPEFGVEAEPLAIAYETAVDTITKEITSVGGEIDAYIKPIKRTFGQWVTRRAVEYKGAVGNGSAVANVNRSAAKLGSDLQQLLADPSEYFTQAVVALLKDQYTQRGQQMASFIIRDIISEKITLLDEELRSLASTQDSVGVTETDDLDWPPPTEATNLLVVLASDDIRPDHEPHKGENEYYPALSARLTAPWLDSDNQRDVRWYSDSHGNKVLAVSAMSKTAVDIAQKIYQTDSTEKQVFDGLWLSTLNKAVSALNAPSNRLFKGLSAPSGKMAEAYAGIPISYGGKMQYDARRIYFTRVQASRLIDKTVLEDHGIDPSTPIVALLGMCKKSSQIKMLQEFTTLATRSLRAGNAGSV